MDRINVDGAAEAHQPAGHRGAVLLNPSTDPSDRCFGQISVGGHVVRCDLPTRHDGAPHATNAEVKQDGDARTLEIALMWAYTQ